MSDDALAALLHQAAFENGGTFSDRAAWLRARGVVVLPPAVAEVLRGELIKQLENAIHQSIGVDTATDGSDVIVVRRDAHRAAKALVGELRAALAVLRES